VRQSCRSSAVTGLLCAWAGRTACPGYAWWWFVPCMLPRVIHPQAALHKNPEFSTVFCTREESAQKVYFWFLTCVSIQR
jgi:hypothetical protein